MHVSAPMGCYNSYRIFQAIETRLITAPATIAPATIRLLHAPVPGISSYPLTIIFICSGQVRVRKYSVKKLLQAFGIVWKPYIIPPDDIIVEVVAGMPFLQAVRIILVNVFFSFFIIKLIRFL